MLEPYDLDGPTEGEEDEDGEIPPFKNVLRFPIKRAA
jgi:hypothetical protein